MAHQRKFITLALFSALLITGCGGQSSTSDPLSSADSLTSLSNSESSTTEESLPESSTPSSENFAGVPLTINLYFRNDAEDYVKYVPYLWWEDSNGKEYVWDDVFIHESGKKFGFLAIDNSEHQGDLGLYVIFKEKGSWGWQTKPDYFIDFAAFPKDDNLAMNVFATYNSKLEVETFLTAADALGDTIDTAYFESFTSIKTKSRGLDAGSPLPVATYWELYRNDLLVTRIEGGSSATFTLPAPADLADRYIVKAAFVSAPTREKSAAVNTAGLFDTAAFQQNYVYLGDDLGATYTPSATAFKVWAPTSSSATLKIYRANAPARVTGSPMDDFPLKIVPMTRGEKGVFSASVDGDYHGRYYTYTVVNAGGSAEVCDPYAVSAGTNGARGQILDLTRTDPEGFRALELAPLASPTDLTVYEMHVQDLTTDASWNGTEANRGKLLGLIEEGTTYTKGTTTVTTGFDHIVELGVNAVQIMPFYDQSNDETDPNNYNWGYNPQNFNVVEGAYSSNPGDGTVRVNEFKQVVQKFASKGIRVVMDVVYNHVFSMSSSSFNKLVPDYFFRRDAVGGLKNDSGVGNDFATERAMASKFIVESVKFWAEEYQIKGFRFDLMSLIDDATLSKVADEIALIDDEIVLWGEPWSGAGYDGAKKVYDTSLANTSFAAFNDQGRNGLKGNNNLNDQGGAQYGWLQKEPAHNAASWQLINKVKGMMSGKNGDYYDAGIARYNDPKKTVNYAGCHDNFSIYDHMLATNGHDESLARNMSLIANALVLTSLGIPFFQGGDEIMRTKVFNPTTAAGAAFFATHRGEAYVYDPTPAAPSSGDEIYYSGNSYNLEASVNSFKWEAKVDNLAFYQMYQNLIKIRSERTAFRLSTPQSHVVAGKISDAGHQFNFWKDVADLSYSAIAAAYLAGEKPLYVFTTGRLYGASTPGTTAATTQTISWGSGDAKVLFDSRNLFSVDQVLTNSITLTSYQFVIVERVA